MVVMGEEPRSTLFLSSFTCISFAVPGRNISYPKQVLLREHRAVRIPQLPLPLHFPTETVGNHVQGKCPRTRRVREARPLWALKVSIPLGSVENYSYLYCIALADVQYYPSIIIHIPTRQYSIVIDHSQ